MLSWLQGSPRPARAAARSWAGRVEATALFGRRALSRALAGGLGAPEPSVSGSLATARAWLRARLRFLEDERLTSRAFLAVALGLGGWLRFAHLNAVGFNSDEAVYAGQAAALAGDPTLQDIFPIFRAHPLLFHVLLSLVFRLGVDDLSARLLTVVFGLLTITVVFRCGTALYGRRVGGLAALFLALMPYHVMVSRQVLLDAPMTLFATVTLLCIARYAGSGNARWLHAAGAALGLTVLTKETGVLFAGSIYVFFALSPEVEVRLRHLATALGVSAIAAAYPLSLMLAGGSGQSAGVQYLAWQLTRRPNHDWAFYLKTVPEAMGLLLLVAVVLLFLWLPRRSDAWRERLLLAWIAVPVAFFQLWPVKGFQYLLPVAPALCLLAARALAGDRRPMTLTAVPRRWLRAGIGVIVTVSLAASSAGLARSAGAGHLPQVTGGRFLAGAGGVPGGRQAGEWIRQQVPEGATLMTIGPSMANILQFYGHRRALGLSVSSNPLKRNPAYEPIRNPDRQLRDSDIQYIVWDAYSARRSAFFSAKLLAYVDKYHGRQVYPSVDVEPDPNIVIYEVRP